MIIARQQALSQYTVQSLVWNGFITYHQYNIRQATRRQSGYDLYEVVYHILSDNIGSDQSDCDEDGYTTVTAGHITTHVLAIIAPTTLQIHLWTR